MDEIERLKEQIAALPVGYISKKTIKGKLRFYRQWTEGGKVKSQYIKEGEYELVAEQIRRRKELEAKLKELTKAARKAPLPATGAADYETAVITGKELRSMTESVMGWQKRDCFDRLTKYLYGKAVPRVCLVYGLRRTGKTTMLYQAIGEMTPECAAKAAYIKARTTDTVAMVNRDLDKLYKRGFRYVFIDEATLMGDFIDSAALFSDVYAAMGMKLVLSGTDSLGFWFALNRELYDRAYTIHTTWIPYAEHARLLGIDDIDEYIRYGGTLRAGETDFDDPELQSEEVSFRDDESTRRYIDTAICGNIQHSLACCEDGNYFRHLRTLYDAGELTGAINRVIENANHRFLVDVLTRDFESHDLKLSAANLRAERDPEKRTDILDRIDTKAVTKRLMELLDIRNREDRSVGVTPVHAAEIKEYLRALDLIAECPEETAFPGAEPLEQVIITQPGMRYCQTQALVHSLMKDDLFRSMSEYDKQAVTDRILEEVRGRMMEEIVLLETTKALGSDYKVFKLRFEAGEYDMVLYSREKNQCAVYEIKHSREAVPNQYRHLTDEGKLAQTGQRFGEIVGRCVLYRGDALETDNGITYVNAAAYLKGLPQSALLPFEGEDMDEDNAPSLEM